MKNKSNPVAKNLNLNRPQTVQMKTRYTRKNKNWKKES
jgi:hypothetical protein